VDWLTVPRDWIATFGEIAKFCGRVLGQVFGLRVFRFFGEALRQAGILVLSSTLVIWGLVFIIGLQCGIEGAYFNRSVGAPAYAGVFSAWCDLRELVPYAFGYMMAAKVGTGIVAELGSMRISDEIDALEVMGISSMTFLCATRLLAAWLVLPFMYLAGIGAGYFASWLAVVQQIGEVSSGGFFLVFWMFQNPPDLLFSVIKAMVMATAIVLVGCYYGYTASGGPVGVGTATAKSMVLNIVLVHLIGMLGTQVFWGANPRAPIGGCACPSRTSTPSTRRSRARPTASPPWSSSACTSPSDTTTSSAGSTSPSPTGASR
jgi:phospholipid/cholesterol/gamma-HCH transport system permease protein